MRFTVETSGTVLSKTTAQKVVESTPHEFRLYGNFPNPFNPTTTIRYELAGDALVTVKVYDVIGREVATLANNERQADGLQNLFFDASALASGVYYYRLTAQVVAGTVFTETRKLLFVK